MHHKLAINLQQNENTFRVLTGKYTHQYWQGYYSFNCILAKLYEHQHAQWYQNVSRLVLWHVNRWRHTVECTVRVNNDFHGAEC